MKRVFVDTSAWFSYIHQGDAGHESVATLIGQHRKGLITTTLVVVETLNLLRYRAGATPARLFGDLALAGKLCEVIPESGADMHAAWAIMMRYEDKLLSFTDCHSFAIMQRLRIDTALTLDSDFRQFGFIALPE